MNRLLGRIFSHRNFRTKFQLTRPQILFLALSLCLLVAALARVMHEAAAAQGASDAPNLSAGVQQQIRALLDEKTSRTPAQQKLDSQLLYALKMRRGEEIAPGLRELSVKVEADADAKTVVDITAIVGGMLLEDLEARGAELISAHPQYNSVRVRVPLNRLEEIAALSPVRFIQPRQEPHYLRHVARERGKGKLLGEELPPRFPARANRIRGFLTETLVGGKTSEGDVTHRAAAARTMFGANGAGVRIGVLGDGVTSLAASQASGDLPSSVTVLPGYTGAGDEGTAMLEIIHDLAPGAQLFFATAGGGIAGFAQAIRDLRAVGCDIIVDDILYASETPFQDGQAPNIVSTTNGGVVWQAVNDVTAAGALYFSTAGNEGNKNDNTSGTWAGDFADGGTLALVPGGAVHNFGGGMQFDTVTATGEVGSLFWADPLGGSGNDYDLFVLNSAGTAVISSSTNVQKGTQDPFEIVGGVSNGNRLVILKKTGAASRFLYLENYGGQLSVNTEGNIRGHSCAAAAYSVAATPAAEASGPLPNPTGPFPNPFSASNSVERFSSDGPRRIFFNASGAAITPGDFLATGGTLRQKPDITAADGVMVTGAGGFPTRFYGTSAAAPHAAAIAAMLKSANPSLTPAQVRTALTASAIDIEGAGVDRDSGAGIVMAFQALQAIGATATANLQTGTIAAAESGGNNNTFIEPGETASLSVQLLNTGPVNATGISAVVATSTPGVVVTAGTSTYPNLTATTGAAVNATPFTFNLTAAASCPLRIDFTLTVTLAGGGSPKVLPFSFQVGQPPLAITSTLDATVPNSGPGFTATTGLQNLRLTRDGQFTTCGSQKPCPGTTSTGTRRYDAYAFTNCATTPSCITVTLNTACSTADKALFATAYLGSFDPNNICASYLADPGVSPAATPASFSFTVPAGASFTVVVSEVNSGASTNCGYTLNLAGLCCQASGAACPTISQLAPATGVPGSNLMVNGSNLNNVTSVKFAGDVTAAFAVVNSSTLNVVIPNGAVNGSLKLSSPGCPDAQTANFAYPSNLSTNNEIAVDDGTMEAIFNLSSPGHSYFVNRLTPTTYPVTLTKVAIFFPGHPLAPPSGTPFEVLTAAHPGGSPNIDGIKFTATAYTTVSGGTFSIFNVPPLTITSGDFVVGFRIPFVNNVFPAGADISSTPRGRSYASSNGSTFSLAAFNFGFRAAILQGCPNVTTVNPSAGAPGTQVTLTGTGLNGVSAVRFFNSATAQFTVNSPTQITVTVPAAAITGPITLSKAGCPDMTTPVFVVGACPTVSGINPATGSPGGTVTITGTNFTGVTGVRFANNLIAQFTVNSATSMTATIPTGASTGPITISKTGCADVQTSLLTIGPGPSLVTTSGRQLLVRKRNADGSLGQAVPYEIRGVNWSPASKNTASTLAARRAEFGNWFLQDIPLLKAMNVNTVRLFLDPGTDATGWMVLDELYRNGIMAAVTVDEATNNTVRAQEVVNFYKRHPAVLMWMLGNEWNINRYYTPSRPVAEAAQLTQTAAALIKTLDTEHPVASSYGELDINDTGTRLSDTQNYVNNICTSVDLWALNIYRGNSFGNLFTQWAALSTKPMFIGEFGTDAFRSFNQNQPPPGLLDGAMQSHWDFCLWNELLANLAPRDAAKAALGGCVFEWNDEWLKVSPAGSQQTGGFAPSNHPDAFANEEYFGIVDIDRQPRPVYTLLATMFAPGYQAKTTFPFRASSRGGGVEEFPTQLGVARFYKCGAYKNFYEKTGGAGGGRGFNIATVNAVTGAVIETRNFDTYGTRNTGDAMRAMIAFLNSQPNGTLILLAVADEAGLNQDSSCSSWPQPWTEDGLKALEALGSTQIRNYCFRDSWAMITVKGQGQARREVLNKTGEASAEVLFDLLSACPTVNITPATLPDGAAGITYNETLTAGGGTAPFSFTLTAGALPSGLSLSTAGTLSGTPSAAGVSNFTVTVTDANGCTGSQAYALTVNNPVPALASLNPNSATAGSGMLTLTVTGTNFVAGSSVRWNGADRMTTFVSAAQLTAQIPASDLATAGMVSVTVFNPAPGGGLSAAQSFTINLPAYEADVAPRPNGSSDGTLTVADWVLVGRFVADLETAAPGGEFQRADCAPRGSLGDGRLTINDWVQAGRYSAGLDPVMLAGGPTAPISQMSGARCSADCQSAVGLWQRPDGKPDALSARSPQTDSPRYISRQIRAAQELLSETGWLAIELDAQGGENALAFSLQFDPAQWRFASANAGRDVSGAALHINARDIAAGRIGVMLAMPAGGRLVAGPHQAVLLRFVPVAGRQAAGMISFADQPLGRELVNVNADSVPVEYSVRTETYIARNIANVSAASFREVELAAESIASAFGSGLATGTQAAETLPLPLDLAGTRVTVTDSEGVERSAPLFFVSPAQVNYLIPAATVEGLATVMISSADGSFSVGAVRIASPAPGLFTANAEGQGIASGIVLRQRMNGEQQFEPVSTFEPLLNRVVATSIDLGLEEEQVFLTLFGTGLRHLASTVSAKVGGQSAEVTYVGPVSVFAGLDQCNLRLPRSLAGRGEVEIVLTVDGKAANSVKVLIK